MQIIDFSQCSCNPSHSRNWESGPPLQRDTQTNSSCSNHKKDEENNLIGTLWRLGNASDADMNGRAKLSPRSAHQSELRTGQVVIATGKAACRKARPSKAGLNIFCPSPPKMILPKPIPNTPPRNATIGSQPEPLSRVIPSTK